ncbi:hypothetical protein N0V92_006968 [Colletotrichum tropicale]|nr:hypothetical protein N0V92_006968 [Colletotrichum tropicale]
MPLNSAFPVVNHLIDEVPAPKYGSRILNDDPLTEDGLSRAKYHENSASVKQMAPITYLIRGNVRNLLEFGKCIALDQLSQGHYHQQQIIDAQPKSLSAFHPPDKDMTLVHAGETGVVMSSYLHTVYPVTRLAQYTKRNQNVTMNNILTLPEDTVSFNARLRFEHKSTSGAIKNPGEFRKMTLRCDLKIGVCALVDASLPAERGNRRLQVLLPMEYKRHNTFSRADLNASTLSNADPRVPTVVRNYVEYGGGLGGFAPPPALPSQNVQNPSVTRVPVLVGLGQGEENEDEEENDPVLPHVLAHLRYYGGHDQVMRDQEVDHRVKPDAAVPPPKAAISSNVRQMSAYSASDLTRWAGLMNGDVQMFSEFAMMVRRSTDAEQWDEGVGDYAVLFDPWESGQWMAGLYAQIVWNWLFFADGPLPTRSW